MSLTSREVHIYRTNLSMEQIEVEEIIEKARLNNLAALTFKDLENLPKSIGSLRNLSRLYLRGNKLTKLPESIGDLTNLTELDLRGNQLNSLPESIGNLSNLSKLDLRYNQLASLPESIGCLSNLSLIYLRNNQLASLPESMSNLSNLVELDLNGNRISDLSMFRHLPNLQIYVFDRLLPQPYWTKFTEWKAEWLIYERDPEFRDVLVKSLGYERIFKELGQLVNMTCLNLNHKRLTYLPESVDRLSNITNLNLHHNKLTSLPESIGNLSNLIELSIGSNQLTNIPDSIGNISNLTKLDLYSNQLFVIPDTIGNLSKLTELNLSDNQLSEIPESIGNLCRLTELSLHSNKLTILPESICHLSNLATLDLESNQLTSLQEMICELHSLNSLDISNNQLTSLPDSFSNLSNLTRLSVNNNPITDLSLVQTIPNLEEVYFLDVYLPRRYWTKLSDWKAEWLLDEDNAEIRRALVEQLGYEKICKELSANDVDIWREYTLLKIDGIETVYDIEDDPIGREPMVLLKMTCPSTQHIHILRVPPEITSAEAAITWVNHGIHPDKFEVQT